MVISRDYIILFPLHTKLGSIKQYLKVLVKIERYTYITRIFPTLRTEKTSISVFDGRRITKFNVTNFTNLMTVVEESAWNELNWTLKNFLGNKISVDYRQHFQQLMLQFQRLECNMTISYISFSTI